MLNYIRIQARDRSNEEKFIVERGLYDVLSSYCFDNARIIEAGPDVGPWTPILLEHIAFTKGISLSWAGIEKVDRNWHNENEYSDGVLFNQDICDYHGTGENADLALSIRPRAYGVRSEDEQANLIHQQHRQLLNMLKTGGHLIIMIHIAEYSLVERFWGPDRSGAAVVRTTSASPNQILVIKKTKSEG